jgi:hypothetical protein
LTQTQQNVTSFSLIAEALINSALIEACGEVTQNKNQTFSFSSKLLARLHKKERDSWKTFSLIVNGRSFLINFPLFYCVSDTFLKLGSSERSFEVHVPREDLPCFSAFLKVFDGHLFHWSEYQLSSLTHIIRIFGLFSLSLLVSKSIPLPNSVPEALTFFNQEGFSFFAGTFNQSVLLLAENFCSLTDEQLHSLPSRHLEAIIQNERVHFKSEDSLLKIILSLIGQDHNRKSLLKNVRFPAVTAESMKLFLDGFSFEDLDADLFEE